MPKRNKRDSQQHTDEKKSSSSAALSNDASWNQRAWRRAGFVPLDRNLVADRALAVAARTSAVIAKTTPSESAIHVQIHYLCDGQIRGEALHLAFTDHGFSGAINLTPARGHQTKKAGQP